MGYMLLYGCLHLLLSIVVYLGVFCLYLCFHLLTVINHIWIQFPDSIYGLLWKIKSLSLREAPMQEVISSGILKFSSFVCIQFSRTHYLCIIGLVLVHDCHVWVHDCHQCTVLVQLNVFCGLFMSRGHDWLLIPFCAHASWSLVYVISAVVTIPFVLEILVVFLLSSVHGPFNTFSYVGFSW